MTPAPRRVSGVRHFPHFDAIRGLAVLCVLVFHVFSLTGQLGVGVVGRLAQVVGGQSVVVFFVLSGFLLYRPYLVARAAGDAAPSPRTFYRRRVLRILPAYWVALTVLALFPGIVGPFADGWWRYYGLLQVYDADTIGLGIPPAWTLCVEATFYLALPAWAAALRRGDRPRWVRSELPALAALGTVGVAVQLLRSQGAIGAVWADALPGQAAWFALGMALAVASVAGAEERVRPVAWLARRPGTCWLAALAALGGLALLVPEGGLLGLVAALNRPQPLGEAVLRLALTVVLVVGFLAPALLVSPRAGRGVPARVLGARPVAFVGAISFSLYLYHLTVAELLARATDPAHFGAGGLDLLGRVEVAQTPVLLLATLAVVVPLAWASRRWVELPFLRAGRGPGTRRPHRAAPGADIAARGRSAALDGVRAIAAVSVFVTHAAQFSGFTKDSPFGPIAARLNLGVAIFFLLSGFLLYRPWVQSRLDGTPAPRLTRYALRRAVRIVPAFWLALTVLALLLPGYVERVHGDEWWAYYGFLQAYRVEWTFSGLSVAWSLSTEVAFYVALPALAWLVARRLGGRSRERQVRFELWGLAASVAVAFGLRVLASRIDWLSMYPNTVLGKWPWFATGLAVAVAAAAWGRAPVARRPWPLRLVAEQPWAFPAAALALLVFSAYGPLLPRDAFSLTRDQTDIELVLFALIGVALLLPAVLSDPASGPAALLGRRPMVWLGTVSYGLFLWHLPIVRWVVDWSPTGFFPAIVAISFAISISCAALSWYALERPLMRRVHRARAGPRRPDRSAEAAAPALEPAP